VVRTRVGYCGGNKEWPTYQAIGDHTETLQLDYDPTQISYQELLDVFWDEHDATRCVRSTQYKPVVFTHDEEQERLALESRDRHAARLGRTVFTEVEPYRRFWVGEDYHQKFWLQNSGVLGDLSAHYPNFADLRDSTAAARVNGYLGRHATRAEVEQALPSLGLSAAGQREVLARAQ
jgi:peptide-methionine (S)-S-oxide reductase